MEGQCLTNGPPDKWIWYSSLKKSRDNQSHVPPTCLHVAASPFLNYGSESNGMDYNTLPIIEY